MLKSIWHRLCLSFPVILFLIALLVTFCPGIFLPEATVRELPIPESNRSREENIRFLLSYVKNSNIDTVQMAEYLSSIIARYGEPAVPLIMQRLETAKGHPETAVLVATLAWIGRNGSEKAVDCLIQIINDDRITESDKSTLILYVKIVVNKKIAKAIVELMEKKIDIDYGFSLLEYSDNLLKYYFNMNIDRKTATRDTVKEIISKWKEFVAINYDYFYYDQKKGFLLIDEEARTAGIPTEEFRKSQPWPQNDKDE